MEIVTLDEIRLIGLSFKKLGWAKDCGKYPQMWELLNTHHRANMKNIVQPFTAYWFWYNEPTDAGRHSYYIGGHVSCFEDVDEALVTFVIPARKYIKHSFNSYDFFKLVDGVLSESNDKVKQWAEENALEIVHMPESPTQSIQVYPERELQAQYPAMYTLTPIK